MWGNQQNIIQIPSFQQQNQQQQPQQVQNHHHQMDPHQNQQEQNNSRQQVIMQQIQNLKDYVKGVQVKKDKQFLGEKCVELELVISPQKCALGLVILLTKEFPEEAPRVFTVDKIKSFLVSEDTNEVIILNLVDWSSGNKQENQLVNVVNKINQYFIQQIFTFSPLHLKYTHLTTHKSIRQALIKVKTLTCEQLFPNAKDQQICNIQNYSTFQEDILKNSQYQDLLKTLVEHLDFNNVLISEYEQKQEQYNKSFEEIQQLSELLESQKENLQNKYLHCTMIKTRFEKTKVLTLLEEQINIMEEESNENVQQYGNFDLFDNNFLKKQCEESDENFMQKLQKHFELRKNIHSLTIKKEKLEEQL